MGVNHLNIPYRIPNIYTNRKQRSYFHSQGQCTQFEGIMLTKAFIVETRRILNKNSVFSTNYFKINLPPKQIANLSIDLSAQNTYICVNEMHFFKFYTKNILKSD